jgi:hypothetical protein
MRADAAAANNFEDTFAVAELLTTSSKREAKAAERRYIAHFQAQGPRGYNKLPASPGTSAAYWFLKRRRLLK